MSPLLSVRHMQVMETGCKQIHGHTAFRAVRHGPVHIRVHISFVLPIFFKVATNLDLNILCSPNLNWSQTWTYPDTQDRPSFVPVYKLELRLLNLDHQGHPHSNLFRLRDDRNNKQQRKTVIAQVVQVDAWLFLLPEICRLTTVLFFSRSCFYLDDNLLYLYFIIIPVQQKKKKKWNLSYLLLPTRRRAVARPSISRNLAHSQHFLWTFTKYTASETNLRLVGWGEGAWRSSRRNMLLGSSQLSSWVGAKKACGCRRS